MNQITNVLHDTKRLRLIACALELLQCEGADSAVIPIPGTEPPRYVAIGTAATVVRLLEVAPDLSEQDVRDQALTELAKCEGSTVNGNQLSRRAKELLAAPTSDQQAGAVSRTERDGWNAAAKALAERAAGHYRNKNYTLQDECLQCASMLHDMKPTAPTAVEQAGAPDHHEASWQSGYKTGYETGIGDGRAEFTNPAATSPAQRAVEQAGAQPVAQVASVPTAWIATDLDGRGDVAFTKEEAKRRAGEGCTIFYPLYEPSNPAATPVTDQAAIKQENDRG